MICHLTCIGLTLLSDPPKLLRCPAEKVRNQFIPMQTCPGRFCTVLPFSVSILQRMLFRLWEPFHLCLLRYLFNSPVPFGKSECWSTCTPAVLWVRFLFLHLYLKCSCSLPRILGLCGPALGREEQLPWLWFSTTSFPHRLNDPRPLTTVTADLERSALTYLTGEVPSGKCPPYQNLALERVWMVVVHLGPPQVLSL